MQQINATAQLTEKKIARKWKAPASLNYLSTDHTSLEEYFRNLQMWWFPKLYTFSVSKFMHSYYNKLLLIHFDDYFIPINSIHLYSTSLYTSKNMLYI